MMEALAGEEPMTPDECAFRAHVAGGRFQEGVDRGRWRLIETDWPYTLIAVSSAPRDNAPKEFVLRFHLDGYPASATAMPWDLDKGQPLSVDQRPKGGRVGEAFRTDWEGGRALYVPCDRVACSGHSDWPIRYPGQLWNPDEGITCYLRLVHELLNDEDYEGV